MTDDISATKHYRQAIATVCEGFTLPDAARKVLETALWNPPTESATTPAEVDAPGIDTANHAGVRVRGYTVEQYATLARQLAEAKAENAIATSVHEHERLNLMSQLAEATRRLGEVRRIFESCVSTMVPADYANGYREALDHVDLALTKEPTK